MKDKYKRFILVPGAFNPPTIAHVKMSKLLCELFPKSSVVYLPARDEYITGWKEQDCPIPYLDRISLLENAINNYEIGVSTVEQDTIITGKTYDVVGWFKSSFKGYEIVICLGEDKLKELPRWYNYEKLISENKFIIMTRDKDMVGLPMSLIDYSPNFIFIDFPYSDISSTKIREAYLSGQLDTVREFIPRNVYEYLQTYKDLFKEADTNV